MAKINLSNFRRGWRTDVDPVQLSNDFTPACENVVFDSGTVETRPGRVTHDTLPNVAVGALALAEYHAPTLAAAQLPTRMVVVGADGRVYVSDEAAQKFSAAPPTVYNTIAGVPDYLTVNTANKIRMQQFKNNMYLVDGTELVRRFMDIIVSTSTASDITSNTELDSIRIGGIAIDATGRVFISIPSHHMIHRFSADGAYDGWYGKLSGGAFGFHETIGTAQADAYVYGVTTALNVPIGIHVTTDYLYVANSKTHSFDRIDIRNDAAATIAWIAGSSDVNFFPHDVIATSDDLLIIGAATSKNTDGRSMVVTECWKYESSLWRRKWAENRTPSTAHPLLTLVSDTVGIRLIDNVAMTFTLATMAEAATSFSLTGTIEDIHYYDGALYVAYGDKVVKHDLYGASLGTVGSKGTGTGKYNNATALCVDATGSVYVASTGAFSPTKVYSKVIKYGITTSTDAYPYVHVTGIDAPTTAPQVVTATGTNFSPGVHEFCYTFAIKQPDGSYNESAASPIGKISTSEDKNLQVTCYIDGNTKLRAGEDVIAIYYRGTVVGDFWRRCDYVAIPDSGTITAYTAIPDGGGALLDSYTNPPPKGCQILIEWQGRMCYTKDDVLYVSQWDDPTRIDKVLQDNVNPDVDGFWIRIGTDGGVITGLGKIGSYLVILKREGVWMLTGSPGQADFSCLQISQTNGCVSHETVQQVGGNLLVWLDYNKVWGFDGQTFRELSRYIAPNLADFSEAEQRDAFAVYDAEHQWYCLTIPKES